MDTAKQLALETRFSLATCQTVVSRCKGTGLSPAKVLEHAASYKQSPLAVLADLGIVLADWR